jgi:hypothetical protein
MSWFEIISVVILGGLFWLWFDSTRVHEIAVERARSQCHVNEVQFLDDTVALANIKPTRDEDGRLIFKRTYTFEYSDTGNNRQPGSIIMLGREVTGVKPMRAVMHKGFLESQTLFEIGPKMMVSHQVQSDKTVPGKKFTP